ncbi:MAG: hypothetical protein JNG86_15605 [Verrucomicrobiaceae bacterium]|nr:hypothetical protein [Verrucomicrobiaceae bacterium]
MENASALPSRRHLIVWSGAAAATGLATYLGWPSGEQAVEAPADRTAKGAVATQKPAEVAPVPSGPINRDLFIPHLNSEFTVKHNTDATAACKLIEVSPASVMKTSKGTFVAFTLLFEAHEAFLKGGGTCQVSHPALSQMEFHLTPVGDRKKKHLLEACFTLRA